MYVLSKSKYDPLKYFLWRHNDYNYVLIILASCVGKKMNFGILRRSFLQIAGIGRCL